MKREYVEGEYQGKIITDFDQTRTIFPEARIALADVMDRRVSQGELGESIELMHASASVASYFDQVSLRKLLPGDGRAARKKIFISYAHAAEKDTGWVGRTQTHLKGLTRSSNVEVWTDTMIGPSESGERRSSEL